MIRLLWKLSEKSPHDQRQQNIARETVDLELRTSNVSRSQTFKLFCWSTETSRRLESVTATFMMKEAAGRLSRDGESEGAVD